VRSDITPGGTFPDYALSDHTSTVRTLSELQGRDPLILMLARGHYCPKEHQQHLELVAFQSKVAVSYTQMVTISTDDHHTLQEFRASVGAQWTFLSDPGRTIQKDLDIQEYTDPDNDPMIPHTLVLKPGLVIHSLYNGYWFWGRPSVDDLWRDLRAATSEIRPDWDLSTPDSARPGARATTRTFTDGTGGPVGSLPRRDGASTASAWSPAPSAATAFAARPAAVAKD
jgi:peroxiredoxin